MRNRSWTVQLWGGSLQMWEVLAWATREPACLDVGRRADGWIEVECSGSCNAQAAAENFYRSAGLIRIVAPSGRVIPVDDMISGNALAAIGA